MSTRTRIAPDPVITNGNMASNITSAVTILASCTAASYGVSWSGTSPVGTLSVQASNDYALGPTGAVVNAGTWNTLTLSLNGTPVSSIPVNGNTGNGMIDITKTGAWALRLIYTAVSGTGTLQATVAGKVA